MKFNFKIQQYQTDAVDSVVRAFTGQPYGVKKTGALICEKFDIDRQQLRFGPSGDAGQMELEDADDIYIYRNEAVVLTDEQLLFNIRKIQAENNIRLSDRLVTGMGRCSLDVEMETGTGKTYVYIKTMFELNKRYGWSKYIVVVPSIAIREGVKKSFEITAEHFMEHYGKKARFFIYNSANLKHLDGFSSNTGVNVMIINTQAFAASLDENKNVEGRGGDSAARIIYSKRDGFGSRRPIDVISANRPIIIMDEPQKMGGAVTRKALENFKPLFCLNYSATHAQQHNLVYVLDALDAYNKRLVKKIEVKGFEVKNFRGTDQYLYLESILLTPEKPPRARVELEINYRKSINREFRILRVGDNLYNKSNEMEQYRGISVSNIDPFTGTVTFTDGNTIRKGEVVGDVSEKDMRRIQIRETIISHFMKEEKLFAMGIKTLTLFFIDEVAKYRQYDEDGNELPGEYSRVFEQEYLSVMNEYRDIWNQEYLDYLDNIAVSDTHKGYFSIDRKTGRVVDSALKRGSEFSDDISAYDLILKNKERLLSFKEPTRFIFSHSALREGWDNPNVFQICALKHSDSQTQKRQEVGRGLRLCVDRDGNRMDVESCGDNVHDINLLTVIASGSYAPYVADLQRQIIEVLYDRPTKASMDYFEGKTVLVDQKPLKLDARQAKLIYRYLLKNDYVDDDDNVTKKYRNAAACGALVALPENLKSMEEGIHKLIQAIFDDSALDEMISDGNRPKLLENPLNERFYNKDFQNLWRIINHRFAYTVDFDSDELIRKAIDHIDEKLFVSQLQYTIAYAGQKDVLNTDLVREGGSFKAAKTRTTTLKHDEISQVKYDLIGKIAEGAALTRKTAAAILKGIKPKTFSMFKNNPEEFISKVIRLIQDQKADLCVSNIVYEQIEGSYDDRVFTAEKQALTEGGIFHATKAVQEYVYTDGTAIKSVERRFVEALDSSEEVCVYAKLPKRYYIPTPFGRYSPDWAIVFCEGATIRQYFLAETKGSMERNDLRLIEQAKINCAKRLFECLSNGIVGYEYVDSFNTLMNMVK